MVARGSSTSEIGPSATKGELLVAVPKRSDPSGGGPVRRGNAKTSQRKTLVRRAKRVG